MLNSSDYAKNYASTIGKSLVACICCRINCNVTRGGTRPSNLLTDNTALVTLR